MSKVTVNWSEMTLEEAINYTAEHLDEIYSDPASQKMIQADRAKGVTNREIAEDWIRDMIG